MFCLVQLGTSQMATPAQTQCNERATQIAESLEDLNPLRWAIQGGAKGECERFGWMDRIRSFGIKRASLLVEYKWSNRTVKFEIRDISYRGSYSYSVDTAVIEDKKILREIRRSG